VLQRGAPQSSKINHPKKYRVTFIPPYFLCLIHLKKFGEK